MLDTSTVIRLGRFPDAAVLPDEPLITAVTLAELSVGPLVARDERERAARQAHLQQAEADFDPLPFDAAAARAFGQVAASLPRGGRRTAARAYDAMIAAPRSPTSCRCIRAKSTTSTGSMGSRSLPCPTRWRSDAQRVALTEYTGGRRPAALNQSAPALPEPKTSPVVVPK